MAASFLQTTYKWARRCVIALVGGTVVLIGVLMIVFPGPAVVVIPAGLAILGLEFAWAKHWLRKIRTGSDSLMTSARSYWAQRRQRPTDPWSQPTEDSER